MIYNVARVREDFPALDRSVNGKPMVYLDNAASTQTPRCVVDSEVNASFNHRANVHRGVHSLSQEATAAMEQTRKRVKDFINADSHEEIVFTRGTTEAINLVAASFGQMLHADDEIIVTTMEHHSNIVPWQLLEKRCGVKIKVVPLNADGSLNIDAYKSLFTPRTRLVSACQVSNVLGTINPIAEMSNIAHNHGAIMCVDGAQAISHTKADVKALGADFYAFSSHKMYGPTGVGVLYGRRDLLDAMPPYQGGGEMIGHVSFNETTWADLPYKFEAGTPDYIGIAALHNAIDYMENIGLDAIAAHEHALLEHAMEELKTIEGIRFFGTAPNKCGVISFLVGNAHHYDTGILLDQLGIEVRTGHHCAQPLMESLGIEGTVRASFAMYNTHEEVDTFITALRRVAAMLQ